MKRKKKMVSAYMTIEASLLFPIIIVLIICIVYLIFYAYNQTIAFQNAAIAALYGKSFSYGDENETALLDNIYSVLEKLNENQYVALDDLKQTVSLENKDIKIVQSGSVSMPFLPEEIVSELAFTENVSVNMQNTVFYIRQIRKVKQNEN